MNWSLTVSPWFHQNFLRSLTQKWFQAKQRKPELDLHRKLSQSRQLTEQRPNHQAINSRLNSNSSSSEYIYDFKERKIQGRIRTYWSHRLQQDNWRHSEPTRCKYLRSRSEPPMSRAEYKWLPAHPLRHLRGKSPQPTSHCLFPWSSLLTTPTSTEVRTQKRNLNTQKPARSSKIMQQDPADDLRKISAPP